MELTSIHRGGKIMMIQLPTHKTKIVCTIGPASRTPTILREMIQNGMSVARLNFSHGNFHEHEKNIRAIRSAARDMNRSVAILGDLPGPKIRIGKLEKEPLEIEKGSTLILTIGDAPGNASRISVSYSRLTESVSPGSIIYLNDGFIELKVTDVAAEFVRCVVMAGGQLLSGKGLNLPGAKIFIDPITDRDMEIMEFALAEGVHTFGISFLETADDIVRAREFAHTQGKKIYAVAKIERAAAVKNIREILCEADAIMIARGDLGVEIPLEEVPAVQKKLIHMANLYSRPVITATQMLESMVDNTRPTRAEVTDVANAIMDGTDAVMLSEETAIGRYPVETVVMMARIATSFEQEREQIKWSSALQDHLKDDLRNRQISVPDTISLNVAEASRALATPFILTPTSLGTTPRRISRLKPESWILAFNDNETICHFLNFSYGVSPFLMKTDHERWHEEILERLTLSGLLRTGDRIILTEGKFSGDFGGTDSLGIITLP
jgi:pyruvate kinase